jgi:hypothetical protein
MTWRLAALFAVVVLASPAQTRRADALRVWYRDGTSLEVQTQSTGGTALVSTTGSVSIDPSNVVCRVVLDKQSNVLFAYKIQAGRAATSDTFFVRIEPLGGSADLERCGAGARVPPGGRIPTLASARDFPTVKAGEALAVDILYNQATGEKIYDVLRPSAEAPGGSAVGTGDARKPLKDDFSLREIQIALNGRTVKEPDTAWLTGSAALIYLPGHGAYFLALGPSGTHPFRPVGRVNRDKLTLRLGNDLIEITSKGGVLKRSEKGVVWAYHDPDYVPRAKPNDVLIRTADDVEYLIAKPR